MNDNETVAIKSFGAKDGDIFDTTFVPWPIASATYFDQSNQRLQVTVPSAMTVLPTVVTVDQADAFTTADVSEVSQALLAEVQDFGTSLVFT